MAKKKRNKPYRPKDVAVPFWHVDDHRAKNLRTEFTIELYEGSKAIREGTASAEQANNLRCLLRLIGQLSGKMEDEELVRTKLLYAEGGASMTVRALEAGEKPDPAFARYIDDGVVVADQVLNACTLYEIHRAVVRAREDRRDVLLEERPNKKGDGA